MPSNEMEQDGGVWPPNYSTYTNYNTSELGQVLTRESNNETAPKSYREVMTQLEKEFKDLQKKRDGVDALVSKNTLYSTYVKAAEENYNHLADLYIEEHKTRLNLEEDNINLKLKIKQLDETYELKEQRIKQQVDQMRSVFTDKFERQKDEFTKTANKQALGRKNIEEKLMMKEMETAELKNKLQEAEAQLQARVKELEIYKVENSQLKLLATYLQNPKQLPAQIPQAPRYQ